MGLPNGTRRRTSGLRRAELATLAGISVDYLARLEQGRDRHPPLRFSVRWMTRCACPPTNVSTSAASPRRADGYLCTGAELAHSIERGRRSN
ncbi:MAG: helix-turn-helix domain-containing protein [Pseudonocardiaceae bacterium]